MKITRGFWNINRSCVLFLAHVFALTFPFPFLIKANTEDQVASKYLEYYFLFQDGRNLEEASEFADAAVTFDRSRTLLREIQALDPSWRPALVNVKLREIQSAINLMEYRQMMQDAEKLASSARPERAKEAYDKARILLMEIRHSDPGWRSDTISRELRLVESKIRGEEISYSSPDAPIVIENEVITEDFLPRVSLPDEMSPLPRAVSTLPTQPAAVPENELERAQALLKETQATLEIITRERDDLIQQLATADSQYQEELEDLRERNTNLSQSLATTSDRLRSSEEEIKRLRQLRMEETIEQLNLQLSDAKAALEEATKKTDAYEKETSALRLRLQQLEGQLANRAPDQPAETNREAEVLNEILVRLNAEQQRREKARDAALAEISRLQIQSRELLAQLDILGAPLDNSFIDRSDRDELTILKNLNAPANTDLDSERTAQAQPNKSTSQEDNAPRVTTSSTSSPTPPSTEKSGLSASASAMADEADRLFSEGKFEEAAAKYEQILERFPDSTYALANYGVISQQLGRTRTALSALERAVQISPDDAFALSMLGIIHCVLGQSNPASYQKAYDVLLRAARLDPNNALIRNYLGISAFNINKPQIAERELRRAIEIRGDYSVAHINLAVIYANQNPPALEMARRHYLRAIQLGHPRHTPTEEKLKITDTDLPRSAISRAG